MLEVIDLVKTFNDRTVVDRLTFRVKPGEIFGLLGPNGAGKTTTIRMLMNIIKADSGEIVYDETPRAKLTQRLFGYLPEERGLYQHATVLRLLVYFGTLNHLSRHRAEIEAIRYLDRMGLIDYTEKPVNSLSKGMQQKIQFIAATLHNPQILILDEPFAGLDPVNQIVLREMIIEYKEAGKIIILSTHQMDQVEKLSEHICLINQGRVILDGKVSDIKRRFREDAYFIEADSDLAFLREMKEITILEEHNQSYKITIKNSKAAVKTVVSSIFDQAKIKKFIMVEPTLHDIFIKLIKKDNSD